ncbi:MAG: response regulator [Actinobacteria bacterium]|nr:MAG: response regulator [Actinomycetota bacterium]
MASRCLIVDDSARFLEAASEFLKREGITVVGVASTSAEALERVQELRPDVALVDIDLGEESGFDLARRIAEAPSPPPVILISTRSEDDLAELIETSPALGYLSKTHLSAHAIHSLLGGGKCLHEALVYSTVQEFLAATIPFIREGLEGEEPVLVVTKEANLSAIRETLGMDAGTVNFIDAVAWYRSPPQTLEAYDRYVHTRLEEGAGRVRVIGEPVWPTPARAVAEWKRYESAINVAWASTPVWVVCPYDAGGLPEEIVTDAKRTHPVIRTGRGTRPSPRYTDPEVFVRDLGLELSEVLAAGP